MGKHLIDPKSSEILSIFQDFPWRKLPFFFWPKLLPALFLTCLKKPWYPCPFEILAEALSQSQSQCIGTARTPQLWSPIQRLTIVFASDARQLPNKFSGAVQALLLEQYNGQWWWSIWHTTLSGENMWLSGVFAPVSQTSAGFPLDFRINLSLWWFSILTFKLLWKWWWKSRILGKIPVFD
jgi:hypothetical protein